MYTYSGEPDPHSPPNIEVFFELGVDGGVQRGWYWWPKFWGADLPDGPAVGPFRTEGEAIADAKSNDPGDVE